MTPGGGEKPGGSIDRRPIRCDLFCAIVDHFGDAGVCWRLARALTARGWQLRLWIDDPAPLALLAPGAHPGASWQGVRIEHWVTPWPAVEVADVVIEAFACELPENYVLAMASRLAPVVWINLEYLSAEDWVDGCHGLPSPHPHHRSLIKYFFFPGFTPASGGLLADFNGNGSTVAQDSTLNVSLFCYDNDRLPDLLAAWAADRQPLRCWVTAGLAAQQVSRWLGKALSENRPVHCGALQLRQLPFLPQSDYDRLLAGCALNFVRGEDSFVRSQWAGRPMIWQAYVQADRAHHDKLAGFLDRYCAGLEPMTAGVLRRFMEVWNGSDGALDWPALRAALPSLASHAAHWPQTLQAAGNLADKLVSFCMEKIESWPFFSKADAR